MLGVSQSTPSLKLGRREQADSVRSAIAQLPGDYAAAIELYDLQGLEIDEVASRMGRSAGAIHMLRARGHERLRGILASGSDFFSRGA